MNQLQLLNFQSCLGDAFEIFNSNFEILNNYFQQNAQQEILEFQIQQFIPALQFQTRTDDQLFSHIDIEKGPIQVARVLRFPQQSYLYYVASPPVPDAQLQVVTVYWTVTGEHPYVFSLTKFADPTSQFSSLSGLNLQNSNEEILALHYDSTYLFCGGTFTMFGPYHRFATIAPLKGHVQEDGFASGLIEAFDSFFMQQAFEMSSQERAVRVIKKFDNRWLVVGGNYRSVDKGQGLVIYDQQQQQIYPFYVDGEIYDVAATNRWFIVVGKFRWINFGQTFNTFREGLTTQNIAFLDRSKFGLNLATQEFQKQIFAKTETEQIVRLLYKNQSIRTIVGLHNNATLYLGGEFEVFHFQRSQQLFAKNLVRLNWDEQTQEWKLHYQQFYCNKAVNSIAVCPIIDNPQEYFIYIGGAFTLLKIFNTITFTFEEFIGQAFLACFKSSVNQFELRQTWRPQVHDEVYYCAFPLDPSQHEFYASHNLFETIYCLHRTMPHVTAWETQFIGSARPWKLIFDRSPGFLSRALAFDVVRLLIYVGGKFRICQGELRNGLACAPLFNNEQTTTPTYRVSAYPWSLTLRNGLTLYPVLTSNTAIFSQTLSSFLTHPYIINTVTFTPHITISQDFFTICLQCLDFSSKLRPVVLGVNCRYQIKI